MSIREDGADILPVFDNVKYMTGTTQDFLDGFRDLKVKGDEIFLVCYPKSGTLWLSAIIRQILNDGAESEENINKSMPCIDVWSFENLTGGNVKLRIADLPRPPVLRTHFPYSRFPKMLCTQDDPSNDPISHCVGLKPKIVCGMRNPWDIAVSWYHHEIQFTQSKLITSNTTWDEFFDLFINNQMVYGSWFDHVLGWWEHRNEANIMFVKYEDVKKDHVGSIKKIAEFLGKTLTDEMAHKIASQTTVSNMKGKEKYSNPYFEHVRKGQVGDWKNFFTDEQNKMLQDLYDKKMNGSGLDLTNNV